MAMRSHYGSPPLDASCVLHSPVSALITRHGYRLIRGQDQLQQLEHFFLRGNLDDSLRLLSHLTATCHSYHSRLHLRLPAPWFDSQPLAHHPLHLPSPQSETQFSHQVAPKTASPLSTDRRPRKRRRDKCPPAQSVQQPDKPSAELSTEAIAFDYFTKVHGIRDDAKLQRLTSAGVKFVQNRLDIQHSPEAFWSGSAPIFKESIIDRSRRLEDGIKSIDSAEAKYDCAKRLALLYMNYDIEKREHIVKACELSQGVGRRSAAIRNYAADVNKDPDSVKFALKQSRHYLTLLDIEGPADVVSLGRDSSLIWERTLKDDDIQVLFDFRKDRYPSATRPFRDHVAAAKIILQGLLHLGWAYSELANCGGKLTKALFRYLKEASVQASDNATATTSSELTPAYTTKLNGAVHLNDLGSPARELPASPRDTTLGDEINEGTSCNSTRFDSEPRDMQDGSGIMARSAKPSESPTTNSMKIRDRENTVQREVLNTASATQFIIDWAGQVPNFPEQDERNRSLLSDPTNNQHTLSSINRIDSAPSVDLPIDLYRLDDPSTELRLDVTPTDLYNLDLDLPTELYPLDDVAMYST
ncbi:hypothetical protein AJ80_08826 [Polytolypa hystricis UAMH7299]|uniref:Uncharacterized protein n=1 Tax=Polytolypa hystricis (strain UAMH7299) TaxID=1447883 RepID=A0A2B7WTC2_POLH7|nr:hypothetical protein AJ80_08826 [Polytolypa hystricis UAMH7299]